MILDEFVVLIKTEISHNFNKGQHNKKKEGILLNSICLEVVAGAVFFQQKRRVLEICGCGPGVKLRPVICPSDQISQSRFLAYALMPHYFLYFEFV